MFVPAGNPWGTPLQFEIKLCMGPYRGPLRRTNTKVTSAKGHFRAPIPTWEHGNTRCYLYDNTWCYNIIEFIILEYAILYYSILYYIILYYMMLQYGIVCYSIVCYVRLQCIIVHYTSAL